MQDIKMFLELILVNAKPITIVFGVNFFLTIFFLRKILKLIVRLLTESFCLRRIIEVGGRVINFERINFKVVEN